MTPLCGLARASWLPRAPDDPPQALPQPLQLFASKSLRASLISAYCAIQPIATLLVGYAVILSTPPPHYGLREATPADLGGAGLLHSLLSLELGDTT